MSHRLSLQFAEGDLVHPSARAAPWRWITRSRDGVLVCWVGRPRYQAHNDTWIDDNAREHCRVPWDLPWIDDGPSITLIIHRGEHLRDITDELTPAEIERGEYFLYGKLPLF